MHLQTIFVSPGVLDSILISHQWESISDKVNVWRRLRAVSINATRHRDHLGNPKLEGNIKNLGFKVDSRGIIIFGSIPKFLFNQNFTVPTPEDIRRFFHKIEEILDCDVSDFNIYRLDISANIIVNSPPQQYFEYLGDCRYYKRFIQDGSLYYQNTQRQFVLYDKIRARRRHEKLPEKFRDAHVLRLEYRIIKRVAKRLKKKSFTVKDLLTEDTFQKLRDLWLAEYCRIDKSAEKRFSLKGARTPKETIDRLAAYAINELGLSWVRKQIDETFIVDGSKHSRTIQRNRDRSKKRVRELSKMDLISPNSLVSELNYKVNQVFF
ncbi:MAG: hypothetical protein MRZ79_27805 [Bacteroidia bacterium]|nr:hypothetical protein [Bacteroidia bacterium]